MKKLFLVTIISSLALILSMGCSSNQQNYLKKDSISVSILDIEKAAEKSGWKITPFKNNEVIAEKTDDGKTVSSSIKFYKGYIEFSNTSDTDDLKEAIEEEFEKRSTSHQ